MQPANPYQAPAADLSRPADGAYDESSPFSPAGRFGRLSYIAWTMVMSFLLYVVIFAVLGQGFLTGDSALAMGLGGIGVQLLFSVPMILFVIRRLHDFDSSGWWALLFLVPLVNAIFGLVLVFRAGSEDTNRFAPPRITRGWEKVLGYIGIGFMVLAVVGIVAAVAIPMLAAV